MRCPEEKNIIVPLRSKMMLLLGLGISDACPCGTIRGAGQGTYCNGRGRRRRHESGRESYPIIESEADKYAGLINLPKDHVVGMATATGKATKPAWLKPGQLPREDVTVRDRFRFAG